MVRFNGQQVMANSSGEWMSIVNQCCWCLGLSHIFSLWLLVPEEPHGMNLRPNHGGSSFVFGFMSGQIVRGWPARWGTKYPPTLKKRLQVQKIDRVPIRASRNQFWWPKISREMTVIYNKLTSTRNSGAMCPKWQLGPLSVNGGYFDVFSGVFIWNCNKSPTNVHLLVYLAYLNKCLPTDVYKSLAYFSGSTNAVYPRTIKRQILGVTLHSEVTGLNPQKIRRYTF